MEVVSMLNSMYSIFDRLTELNGVYKVCQISFAQQTRWIIHTDTILSGGDDWWCLHGRGRGSRQRRPSCSPNVWYGIGYGRCYTRSDWSFHRSSTKNHFFPPSSSSLFQLASITIAPCISPCYCVSSVVRQTEGICNLASCYIAVMEKIQRYFIFPSEWRRKQNQYLSCYIYNPDK